MYSDRSRMQGGFVTQPCVLIVIEHVTASLSAGSLVSTYAARMIFWMLELLSYMHLILSSAIILSLLSSLGPINIMPLSVRSCYMWA